MSEIEVKALIEKYANGIYIGRHSKPPMSVCIQHMEEFVRELDEIRSTPPAAAVTEGWQLVPKEPTEVMKVLGCEYADPLGRLISWDPSKGDCTTRDEVAGVYKAMLSASPSPVGDRDALIERLQQIHDEQHSILGQMLLDKSEEGKSASNWQGGKVNGIASAIAALAAKEQQP